MIEKLKNIYKSFYLRLNVQQSDCTFYAEESVLKMLVLFTDKLLKSKLDQNALDILQRKYEDWYLAGSYKEINDDLQKYIDENSQKLLIESFMEVVLEVVKDLKDGEAIDEQKISELGVGLKMDLENMVAVTKVDQAGTVQEGLQALASNNVEQVQPTQAMVEPEMTEAPVMNEPNQAVQKEPVVESAPVMSDQPQAVQNEPVVESAPVMGDQSQAVQNEPVVASTPVVGDQPQASQTEPQAFAN